VPLVGVDFCDCDCVAMGFGCAGLDCFRLLEEGSPRAESNEVEEGRCRFLGSI
jgi:hypothetical protein